jgi:hypothetical protein
VTARRRRELLAGLLAGEFTGDAAEAIAHEVMRDTEIRAEFGEVRWLLASARRTHVGA